MKEIFFGNVARKKIKEGIDKCVDVVKVSLGHKGRNVLIFNGNTTDIINDGVSIARAVDVKDNTEQAGIMLAKQCASMTNNQVGDGTTTTLVLLQSLLNELINDTQLTPPRELREQIFESTKKVLENLDKGARKIESIKDIENIALTSSLDPKIAKLIAEIYEKLGQDANIIIQETSRDILESEIVEGIQFDSRNVALYSDEEETYEDIPVVVFKEKAEADNIAEKLRVLTSNGDNEILVIAPQWSKDALALLVQFKMRGTIKVAAVQNNEVNEEDLVAFGNRATKVIVTKEKTTLVGGNGNTTEYVKKLKEQYEKEESKFQKELLKKRISFMAGGIAIIHVGKPTDVAREELALKVEDAINAAKSAYDGGITIGAGIALKQAAPTGDTEGDRIMRIVCESPNKQICENAGETTELQAHVTDSIKVIKSALTNAVSTATSILTAEAALINIDED